MNAEIGEIVKEYLSQYPTIPSRRIAVWIHEKYPDVDIETARTRVRYYRQQCGAENRLLIASDEFANQKYDLPVPSKYDSSDFRIEEAGVLILSDLQIPFQDNRAIETTLDWAEARQKRHNDIKAVLLNGDILDCYQLSTFSRDPRERNIQEEIDDCKDFLGAINETLGIPIYWKFGNHEERFERYLYQHAGDLAYLSGFTDLESHVDLKKFNCKVIKDKRVIKIGHLNVVHGHEFKGGIVAPVNPARTLFLRAKEATIAGDKHVTSEHSGRTIGGKLITCWSVGCLCNLKPKYMPMNEWNHGFAFVNNYGDTYRVLNIRIENGVVY